MAELAQYAALPYVHLGDVLHICLITSRETKRWVIPKGWPKPSVRPYEQAAREAREEAGLVGEIAPDPLGSYVYNKRMSGRKYVTCRVSVFPFLVLAQHIRWPEMRERQLLWTPIVDAAGMVAEPDLALLLSALPVWVEAQQELCI